MVDRNRFVWWYRVFFFLHRRRRRRRWPGTGWSSVRLGCDPVKPGRKAVDRSIFDPSGDVITDRLGDNWRLHLVFMTMNQQNGRPAWISRPGRLEFGSCYPYIHSISISPIRLGQPIGQTRWQRTAATVTARFRIQPSRVTTIRRWNRVETSFPIPRPTRRSNGTYSLRFPVSFCWANVSASHIGDASCKADA